MNNECQHCGRIIDDENLTESEYYGEIMCNECADELSSACNEMLNEDVSGVSLSDLL